jgi:hypothetical protein
MRNPIAAAVALSMLLAAPSFAARYPAGTPGTTNNDDSCDLGNFPAATLLLPYFEVDLGAPQQRTMLVTITNTSRQPQIAKVILWTDYGYPVIDFNIFLTGYDVQSLNLADILVRGVIASSRGTSVAEPQGELSAGNTANPNFAANVASACAPGLIPGQIPASLVADVRTALTAGTAASCGTARIGGLHPIATASRLASGYATIDLVSTCSTKLPLDDSYWDELLYDNVLAGDYEQIGSDVEAGGNPLVHIRAVPEGGKPGEVVATNLPHTFYDRFTPLNGPRKRDRRQPLPSAFAARFIEGPGGFNTDFRIWREGVTGVSTDCRTFAANGELRIAELVRFDEHENPTVFPSSPIGPSISAPAITLPLASRTSTSNTHILPPLSGSGDAGGWLYLNLNDGSRLRPSQNWVIVTMSNGRFSTDVDAIALGNGCSPAPKTSEADNGAFTIGPLPDANP